LLGIEKIAKTEGEKRLKYISKDMKLLWMWRLEKKIKNKRKIGKKDKDTGFCEMTRIEKDGYKVWEKKEYDTVIKGC